MGLHEPEMPGIVFLDETSRIIHLQKAVFPPVQQNLKSSPKLFFRLSCFSSRQTVSVNISYRFFSLHALWTGVSHLEGLLGNMQLPSNHGEQVGMWCRLRQKTASPPRGGGETCTDRLIYYAARHGAIEHSQPFKNR